MLNPRLFLWFLLQYFQGSLACSGVSLRQVELKSAASTLYIDEGSNLLLVPAPELLNGSDLYWQSSGSPIAEYQSFLPCAEQDPPIVVHENGRDLLMIGIDETSAVQRLFVSNGSKTISVQLKITQKSIAATDVSSALTWVGIVGGFFLIMIAFVVIMRFIRRSAKKEKSEKPVSAASTAKQSEAPTKNETVETAKESVPEKPFGIQIASSPMAAELGAAAPPPAAVAAEVAAATPTLPPTQPFSPV